MSIFRLVLLGVMLSGAQLQSQTPAPAATVPLGEIAQNSQAATATLAAIAPEAAPDPASAATRAMLPELSDRIDLLLAESNRASAAGSASLDTLRDREATWRNLRETLAARAELLFHRAKTCDAADAQIAQVRGQWQSTEKAATAASAPPETLGSVRTVLTAADATTARVRIQRNAILELQARVGDLQAKVRGALDAVNAAQASAVRTLWERDSPPLWSSATQLDAALLAENNQLVAEQRSALSQFIEENWHRFALHGVFFFLLLILFLWLRRGIRRWTETDPQLQQALPIFEVPIAAALALSFLLKGAFYNDAPTLLRAVLGALLLLPTLVILRRLLEPRLHRVPHALVVFYFLDQVQIATAAFPRLTRLIFAAQMIAATATFAWLAPTTRRAGTRGLPPLFWLAAALTLAALVASVFGYTRLSGLLGTATLRSSYVAVVLYALFSILRGLLLVAGRVRPAVNLRIVREHREKIEGQATRLLGLLAIGAWAWETLEFFGVREATLAVLAGFLGRPIAGSFLTPGHLLGFIAALWLSVLVSRFVRFILHEEIYERVHLAPGLPYAISAVVNYGVLLIGFVIALGLLGVDLTKITIIASAFSVGLGFGLQNVINNFVSGIILLFERPIRVGDVIQIGEASGEVRRIGIRASIIRLPDGADLIVPNGNLISNPVTNWTYNDRSRAVEIALTLDAPPADSTRILELLRTVADEQTPGKPPQVFITGLAAGKLNITIRVWASAYEDATRLRSDLSAHLFTALAREKIAIV